MGITGMGGRTYSVEVPEYEEVVVDVGAAKYRMDQLLVSSLIENRLNLETTCYDCENVNFNTSKIISKNGLNAGFISAIRSMVQMLYDKGAKRVLMGHKLVKISENNNGDRPLVLVFENGFFFFYFHFSSI